MSLSWRRFIWRSWKNVFEAWELFWSSLRSLRTFECHCVLLCTTLLRRRVTKLSNLCGLAQVRAVKKSCHAALVFSQNLEWLLWVFGLGSGPVSCFASLFLPMAITQIWPGDLRVVFFVLVLLFLLCYLICRFLILWSSSIQILCPVDPENLNDYKTRLLHRLDCSKPELNGTDRDPCANGTANPVATEQSNQNISKHGKQTKSNSQHSK